MPNTKKATTRRTLSTCSKPRETAFSRLFLSRCLTDDEIAAVAADYGSLTPGSD